MKKFLFAVAALVLLVPSSWSYDKVALEIHIRKALNLDTRTPISVGQPEKSEIEGLTKIPITIADGTYPIYMSKDEKQYIWGNVVDYTQDPDKVRADKISLKNVHAKGSPSAPVTVVEYTDLQCPHCQKAHDELNDKIYKAYKESQVRLVFKHFPLSGHDWAEPAAVASECASQQKESAFWDVTDKFYMNASTITSTNVYDKALEFAKDAKLNAAKFDACQRGTGDGAAVHQKMLDRVRADKKEGTDAGVSSTPTFFVNGRVRRGIRDFDDVKILIDEKLPGAKK